MESELRNQGKIKLRRKRCRGWHRSHVLPDAACVQVRGKKRRQKKSCKCGFQCERSPSAQRPIGDLSLRQAVEKFLPIRLYCVIPTKQTQKEKSQLPTFIYN